MNIISRSCLTLFEVMNEVYIGAGAGVIGLGVLVIHGYKSNQLLRTLAVASISVASLVYVFRTGSEAERRKASKKKVIFISGCDSGLGFSLALHASEVGFTVIAGFLSLESMGAQEIKKNYKNIKQIQLDITDKESIFVGAETIKQFIENANAEFYALINNSAVMVFGEFEWQTDKLIEQQINVNLTGTFTLTRAFIPLLRKHKGRAIFITSHCSYACLPGLAVYGATKAGISAFCDGLRVETSKYGIKVITFTPGSFVAQSNIMAKHSDHVKQMHDGLSEEQHAFYEDYFQRYNAHLLGLNLPKTPKKIDCSGVYSKFEEALLEEYPHSSYKVEPLRYALYHFIFKFTPVAIRDYFVVKFMCMPEYSMNQTW